MYANKGNVLQLVALLKAYGMKHIVISAGSRNSPLAETFSADAFFECHSVVDERSAAFYALGLIEATGLPVAACCTSGTAVLNYAPAVAEAYYQQLPLLLITADRPECWIDQMAGQTIRQQEAFGTMIRKSVQLPEIESETDEWFCNRLINEALLELTHLVSGPVQINVPISEPLCDYSVKALPTVRKITRHTNSGTFNGGDLSAQFYAYSRRMVIVGQMPPCEAFEEEVKQLAQTGTVIVAEHLSNLHTPEVIGNFDRILAKLDEEHAQKLTPELLVTMGGHIVSKRIWQFIRTYPPKAHWHVSPDGRVVDLSQHLNKVIEATPSAFIAHLLTNCEKLNKEAWREAWREAATRIEGSIQLSLFSERQAIGYFIEKLPSNTALHLANSSTVRYAQLFPLKHGVKVFCNRGTSGIDGCLSTAAGYASATNRPTFIIIGDLAFFFDMNILRNLRNRKNFRVLLINNHRGDIFYKLPGMQQAKSLETYIAATHQTDAKGWAESVGFTYLSAQNSEELQQQMELFTATESDTPLFFEVFTSNN